MKYKKTTIMLASAAILAAGTQFAGAVPSLQISSGNTTYTINDQDFVGGTGLLVDQDTSANGVAVLTMALPGWNITITLGQVIPNPALGISSFLHFGVNAGASTGAQPLTILFSNDAGPTLPSPFTAIVGGNLAGGASLVVENWYGGTKFANGVGSGATLATDFSFINNGGSTAALSSLGPVTDSGTWTTPTWTTKAVLDPHGIAGATSFDESKVPDGGTTLALLGGSMLGLGAIRRKFGKR